MAVVVAVVVASVASKEHLGQYVARRAILLDENFGKYGRTHFRGSNAILFFFFIFYLKFHQQTQT